MRQPELWCAVAVVPLLVGGCRPASTSWKKDTSEIVAQANAVIESVASLPECSELRAGGLVHWRAVMPAGSAQDAGSTTFVAGRPRIDLVLESAWNPLGNPDHSTLAHELCHVCGYADEREAEACAQRSHERFEPIPEAPLDAEDSMVPPAPVTPAAAAWEQDLSEVTLQTDAVIDSVAALGECLALGKGGLIHWRAVMPMCLPYPGPVLGCSHPGWSPRRVDLVFESAWNPDLSPGVSTLAHELCHVCGYGGVEEADACARRSHRNYVPVAEPRLEPAQARPPPGVPPPPGSWSSVPAMTTARALHGAVLLPSGHVLVAGGIDHLGTDLGHKDYELPCLSSVERYDPVAGTWTNFGRLAEGRCSPAVFPIRSGPFAGKLIVVGGMSEYFTSSYWRYAFGILGSTELFDPLTRSSSPGPGLLTWSRSFVQLADGTLLGVGGICCQGFGEVTGEVQRLDLGSPEPAWRHVHPMNEPRGSPSLVLLESGEVLAIGGLAQWDEYFDQELRQTAERYDPRTDTWRMAAPPPAARWKPVTVRLPGGDVLFTAGCPEPNGCSDPQPMDGGQGSTEAWIYEPGRDVWRPTTPMHQPRALATGVLLDSGNVLVAGGNWRRVVDGGQVEAYPAPAAEVFDPNAETWSLTSTMPHYGGFEPALVELPSGDVLWSGGFTYQLPGLLPAVAGARLFRSPAP